MPRGLDVSFGADDEEEVLPEACEAAASPRTGFFPPAVCFEVVSLACDGIAMELEP